MNLFPCKRQAKRSGCFERARESEIVRFDVLTAHFREIKESRGEITVLDRSRNEGGPGDDAASWGELEEELG